MGGVLGNEWRSLAGFTLLYRGTTFFSTRLGTHPTADWHTREEARTGVFAYLETWYNLKRRHSTLGYLSPAAYEEQLQPAA
jgi:transposase InsO family protein